MEEDNKREIGNWMMMMVMMVIILLMIVTVDLMSNSDDDGHDGDYVTDYCDNSPHE